MRWPGSRRDPDAWLSVETGSRRSAEHPEPMLQMSLLNMFILTLLAAGRSRVRRPQSLSETGGSKGSEEDSRKGQQPQHVPANADHRHDAPIDRQPTRTPQVKPQSVFFRKYQRYVEPGHVPRESRENEGSTAHRSETFALRA